MIRKAKATELHRFYKTLKSDFHPFELLPEHALFSGVLRGKTEPLIYADAHGNESACALCAPASLYGYVLINYLCAAPEARGAGAGGAFIEELALRYAEKQGLIVELTETPGEEVDHERRVRFYSRHGFVKVPCDYRYGGVESGLMARPLAGTADISRVAHLIIREIYSGLMPPGEMKKTIDIRAFPAERRVAE